MGNDGEVEKLKPQTPGVGLLLSNSGRAQKAVVGD